MSNSNNKLNNSVSNLKVFSAFFFIFVDIFFKCFIFYKLTIILTIYYTILIMMQKITSIYLFSLVLKTIILKPLLKKIAFQIFRLKHVVNQLKVKVRKCSIYWLISLLHLCLITLLYHLFNFFSSS